MFRILLVKISSSYMFSSTVCLPRQDTANEPGRLTGKTKLLGRGHFSAGLGWQITYKTSEKTPIEG